MYRAQFGTVSPTVQEHLQAQQRTAVAQYRAWLMAELARELRAAAAQHFGYVAKINREYDQAFAPRSP